MIKKLFSLAAMALLAASCTNDVDNVHRFNLRALKDAEFFATIEDSSEPETKVFADAQRVAFQLVCPDRTLQFKERTNLHFSGQSAN